MFFNYVKPPVNEKDYFNQTKKNKQAHENFWAEVILNLKKSYKNKNLSFVTFNYTYYAEIAMYVGCNRNSIPINLWHKEGIKTDLEADIESKKVGARYSHVLKYFDRISVYNQLVKKMFIKIDKSSRNKIIVNGCPRIQDYIIQKSYIKKINTLLFLSFSSRRGIPNTKKNKSLNWNLTYSKVIKILNDISDNKNLNIIIKTKSNAINQLPKNINKKIKIFSFGTAKQYINEADIIIGHNSASTIEALINGKYVMVPFFEKKMIQKKYLYKFNKKIIYTSEKNMKNKILKLINKQTTFPLSNKKHQKTISYYLGNYQDISKKYSSFFENL